MSADTLFCNPGRADLRLAETSPWAERASECGEIGRYGVSCTSAVEEASWGTIKASFR